ncbi:MAG: hypothetical protein GEU75_12955 [Dehalococcoidia bacterium]|nr:hypothetical protein [Dehalococcoidia bacterium]
MEATATHSRRLVAVPFPEIDAPRLCLVLFSIAFFAFSLIHPTDPDYWWHLRTGELIVETKAVPQTDPFSFTAEGEPWIAHEWLSELVIYGVESAGGYAANVLLFSAIALAALLVAYRTAIGFGVSRWLAVLFFVWAGFMSSPYWVVRPQAFTWLFFALFVAVCVGHSSGKGRLWALPVLMVLWANLHGGYVFGLGVVGLYTLALIGERLLWHSQTELKPVLLALAGCFAATLISPNPVELLLYPFEYLRPGNASMALISEWQSPDFHSPLFVPLAVALVTLIGIGVFGGRKELFLPLLTLCFAFFALQSLRNQPLFAMVFLIMASARCVERFDWARLRPSAAEVRSVINGALIVAVAIAVVVVMARSGVHQVTREARTDGVLGYPSEGVAFIQTHYPEARLFNDYGWGGYLIQELYPQKVFIDGRADVYGDTLMQRYQDVMGLHRNWRLILEQHGIDLIIIEANSALAERLDAETGAWRRVFTGPVEAIFVRTAVASP